MTQYWCSHFLAVLVVLLHVSGQVYALKKRTEYQYPTENPLDGCPAGTILVGPSSQYKTIQSAILSLPNDTTPQHILILPGQYTEQLNVTRPGPLTLFGQTANPQNQSSNGVGVYWAAIAGTGDNAYTSVLTVAPNLNASLTGSGPTGFPVPADTPFGNTDFKVYNVNFTNNYAPYADGPSLALSMGYANASFYYCGFYSYQDTVRFRCATHLDLTLIHTGVQIYVGKLGNAYFYKNEIAGQTDFFYGKRYFFSNLTMG